MIKNQKEVKMEEQMDFEETEESEEFDDFGLPEIPAIGDFLPNDW